MALTAGHILMPTRRGEKSVSLDPDRWKRNAFRQVPTLS
jgi:hypothetical protein